MTVDDPQSIKARFIRIFIMTMGVMCLGSVIALNQIWHIQAEEARAELERSAAVTIGLVESSILIASKAVDIGVDRINDASTKGVISDKQSYDILHSTIADFNFQENANYFGLLFYVDKNGIIRAENSGYPAAHKDVSDRVYFKELSSHPRQQFSIGNLVVGKTNQKITFHFAESVALVDGVFNGLLMQQIDADRLTHTLNGIIDGGDARLYVQTPSGRVVLAYPRDLMMYFISPDNNEYVISGKLDPNARPAQIIELYDGVKSSSYDFVGASESSYFGLVAYSRLSFEKFLYAFLWRQAIIFVYILLGAMILAIVFYRLYKNALELHLSNQSATHDALTGLFNRRYLDENLPVLWRNAMREQEPISALFVDIDFFKIFNDTYGHETGDDVLKLVAKTINDCLHRPMDFSCRWGGEEFAVLLVNTELLGAVSIAGKILDAIRKLEIKVSAGSTQVRVSIGVASMLVTDKNITDDIIDMADKAMLQAKHTGRDRYAVYEPKSV